jgi:hypothetical protein
MIHSHQTKVLQQNQSVGYMFSSNKTLEKWFFIFSEIGMKITLIRAQGFCWVAKIANPITKSYNHNLGHPMTLNCNVTDIRELAFWLYNRMRCS